jgi:DNA-binding winged helix-turn-helix (wHTH) protein/Tol biopolymer transport system component
VESDNGTRSIRFGTYELDLRAGELRRNGSKVKLQEQPLKVLTILLEHPGEVVTREQLQKALWPEDTFVDFDHSLNAAIRRLRDAFGDSAEDPRFVETVARRGYRFLAPVNGYPDLARAAAPPAIARPKHWPIVLLTATLALGVMVGLLVAYWPHRSKQIELSQVKQRRLTANPEEDPVKGAAISPDGRYLAFADNTGFYLREADSGETHALKLPAGFSAVPVAWYPDGAHVIVSRPEGPYSQSGLWKLSIMGGSAQELTADGRQPAVSPDGSRITFVRGQYLENEIWLMGATGENQRPLSLPKKQYGTPAWSPDGRKIAFPSGVYLSHIFKLRTSIQICDVGKGLQETVLSPEDARKGMGSSPVTPDEDVQFGPAVVWTRDNHLIYSISEPIPNQGDSNVWSVPLDTAGHVTGPSVRLLATPDEVSNLSATADGKRIAVTKDSENPDIYITELNSAGTRLSVPRRLTLDERRDLPFSWTPDSKAVLFSSDRDGTFHIFKQQIDQTVPELLVGGNEQAMGPRLAPDNATVLYVIWPRLGESVLQGRVMRIPLSGGPPQTVLEHSSTANLQCARSPSTLCVYDDHGENEISFYRFDPSTGHSEELPQARIHDPIAYSYNWSLSPDGKVLALCKTKTTEKNPSITFLSLEDGSKRTVEVAGWAGIANIDFAADGKSVWATAFADSGQWELLKISMQGRARPMLKDDTMEMGWAIPAPDGKHLAIWKARQTSNVWLLERF